MRKQICYLLLLLFAASAIAQPPAVREIFVPHDDLHVVLEGDTQRVFVPREEYEALLAKAKTTIESVAPIASAITSAEYTAKLEPGRALIEGKITVETLHDGLQFVPLRLFGVGVRSALLDDAPAILVRDPEHGPMLAIDKRGRHVLTLTLTAPLVTNAAQQSLQIELPQAAAARLSLSVPGNVEVKSGAAVIDRAVDAEANQTSLELALGKGPLTLVLSLNNKQLSKDAVALARSVFVDELTQSYERLHARVTLVILHGGLENAQLEVPAGFEITSVVSPLVSRWEVKEGLLDISFREPATDAVVIDVSAVSSGPPPEDWRFPQLLVKNVEAQAAVVGLLLEDRLQAKNIAASSLVSIDTSILTASISPEVMAAGPGLPAIRPVVAYYAPAEEFSLAASFEQPAKELWVTSSVLLTVGENSQKAEVNLSLLPRAERLFELDVLAPAGWDVTAARRADGQPLSLERYPQDGGVTRLRLMLPGGAPLNISTDLVIEATSVPAGWLTAWKEKTFTFPVFKVVGADREDGAVAIAVSDDLQVHPEKIGGLLPLTEAERRQFQLGQGAAALAYRHQGALGEATFTAVRRQPSIVAEVYAFHRFKPAALEVHYELNYDVREAAVQELSFSLPADTPNQVLIRGLGDVVVKDTRSEVVGKGAERRRVWHVQLDGRRRGVVKLQVDLEMKLPSEAPKGFVVPNAKVEGAHYQTGLVAVEGHSELDLEVVKHPRKVDEGELFAAEYQVGKRLVGAFGYLGDAEVQVDIVRHEPYALPSALSRTTQLKTQVGIGGVSQTEATYMLRTKAAFLEIELPAAAELWTITLDDQPTKPQKNGGRLLLSLPTSTAQRERQIKIVYEQPTNALHFAGSIELNSPRLLVRETAADEPWEVPSADAQWQLVLPTGYEARRSFGNVDRTLEPRPPAAWRFVKMLADWGHAPRMQWAASKEELAFSPDSRRSVGAAKSAATPSAAPPPKTAAPLEDLSMSQSEMDAAPQAAYELSSKTANETRDGPQAGEEMTPQAKSEPAAPKLAPPAAVPVDGKKVESAFQSLKGVAGLLIGVQVETCSPTLQLESLGEAPAAGVTLIRREPLMALGWAAGLAVFAFGMLRVGQSGWERATYVGLILIISTLFPLLLPRSDVWGEAFDGAFFGAAFTALAYIVLGLGGSLVHASRNVRARWLPRVGRFLGWTTSLVLLSVLIGNVKLVSAQESPVTVDGLLPLLIEDPKPVKVPENAVVIPFDPADEEGLEAALKKANKVLVPYAMYEPLWKQAFPDKKLVGPEPRLPYGIGAARYQAQLGSDDVLDVQGTIDLEVFTNKPVAIPLGVAGGVLLSAKVDGAAARLQIAQLDVAKAPDAAEPIVLLHLLGKGRKKLELGYRFKLERQGGWRVARGALPAVGGAGLTITGPNAAAEIRLSGVLDRDSFETAKAAEVIETALDPSGRFSISWRPKLAENMVDRGVAARSQAVFDVRQDVLRLTWRMTLEFPRTRRDRLSVETPAGYVVERVVGENVRSWEATKKEGMNSDLEVVLLKEAADHETITIYLARYGAVGYGEMATLAVPVVTAAGAPLQQGTIMLRRDPLLDVRITTTLGVAREDAQLDQALAQAASAYDIGPLDVQVFQAYRFSALPVNVALSIAPQPVRTEAEVQAILNVGERSTTVETGIVIMPRELPVHRVEIAIPKELVDEEVSSAMPGGFERSIVERGGKRVLQIYCRSGQLNPFTITIAGKLERLENKAQVSVPQFEVLGVARQQGSMVVQADPAYDVHLQPEAGAEVMPLASTFHWLQPQKRANARAALRWQSPGYAANVQLEAKTPVISSRLFHNVRITTRTLEQTIIAEFEIREAGVKEITLLLPKQLQSARVEATNARRTLVESTDKKLPAGFARLRILLEDEFQGTYKVKLVHDRLISSNQQAVELPVLEVGSPQKRFLSIESAGRDEVILENAKQLEPLARGQQAYSELVTVLGGDTFTQAYVASSSGPGPALTLSLKQREVVETAAARIGLAETLLIMDRAGAYRAKQVYNVDNSSEQFLEVQLPADSQLWTVTVDGLPVKPVRGVAAGTSVRIPIIRRARGDADYKVVLIYAGKLHRLGWSGRVDFPFPQTININVERSVVRVLVPENHWHRFDGTLGQPVGEDGVQQTTQEYFRRQISLTVESMKSGDKFARARSENNLKQLGLSLNRYRAEKGRLYEQNEALAQQYSMNTADLQKGLKEAEEQLQEDTSAAAGDNRQRLNYYFNEQNVQRSKNVVGNDIRNFDQSGEVREQGDAQSGKRFNKEWLEKNQLARVNEQPAKPAASRYFDDSKKSAPGKDGEKGGGQRRPMFGRGEGVDPFNQTATPPMQQAGEAEGEALEQTREQALGRYRSRLAKQTEQQQKLDDYAAPNAGPGDFQLPGIQAGGGLGGMGQPGGVPMPPAPVVDGTSNVRESEEDVELGRFGDDGRNLAIRVGPPRVSTTGFASLNLDLPSQRAGYREYRFVTARGELEITSSYVESNWLKRLGLAALSLVVIVGVFFAARSVDWSQTDRRLRWIGPVALVLIGLLVFLMSDYGRWGLVAIVVGGLLLVRSWLLVSDEARRS